MFWKKSRNTPLLFCHHFLKNYIPNHTLFIIVKKALEAIDFIRFEKDTLKVCSQKFVETIDNDKLICYNKAKLRDRNKKTKKS